MTFHTTALRLLDTLNGDPETIAQIARYIEHQASLERVDNPSVARLADAAERRSCEAVARVATLNDDLRRANARIVTLEASGDDLMNALIELANDVETLKKNVLS